MVELSDIIKKTIMGVAIVGISYGSLEAQHRTGSDYLQGSRPDKYQAYCTTNKGREANMNKYRKAESNSYCNFNSKKHLNSKNYKPQAHKSKNYCFSKHAKRYNI